MLTTRPRSARTAGSRWASTVPTDRTSRTCLVATISTLVSAIEQAGPSTAHQQVTRFLLATKVSEILVTLGGLALVFRPCRNEFLGINTSLRGPALALGSSPPRLTYDPAPAPPASSCLGQVLFERGGCSISQLSRWRRTHRTPPLRSGATGHESCVLDTHHRSAAARVELQVAVAARVWKGRRVDRHCDPFDRGAGGRDDVAAAAEHARSHAAPDGRLGRGAGGGPPCRWSS